MEQHHLTIWGNIASGAAVIGSIVGFIPGVAAIVALVWYVIQIAESQTVRRWLATRRQKKIARLQAKIILLETAQLVEPPPPPDDG